MESRQQSPERQGPFRKASAAQLPAKVPCGEMEKFARYSGLSIEVPES